ncbi:Rev1 [Symbiodinium natans]|uniref:Rev1 protein n=1 Tax=Symbiodinium natans TaxID=878477 RepID=A0A812M031_9DINO|nr:Rev1 [Symbiodinium natans]
MAAGEEELCLDVQLEEPQLEEPPTSLAYQARLRAAKEVAEGLRAKEPLLQNGQRTVRDNPNFVQTFFKASRLHFIGVWRERYEEILDSLPPPPPLPAASSGQSVFVHIDMDCFFASVATRGRQQTFAGLPVAVAWGTGSSSEISSANYCARAFGVRAGMWAGEAFQLCPDLVVMPYEFDAIMETAELFYRSVLDTTPYVQGISCDEVFADVTHLVQEDSSSWLALARKIRADIWSRSGCVASIGVAKNRLLARLATKFAKPRPGCATCGKAAQNRASGESGLLCCEDHPGIFLLEDTSERLAALAARELPGVGPESEKQLRKSGVESVGDLRDVSLGKLRELFGEKQAQSLFHRCRGIDDRPWDPRPPRKSVGAQIAWGVRFEDVAALRRFVSELTEEVLRRLARHGKRGSSLTVKVWKARPDAPHLGGVGSWGCDILSRSAQFSTDPGPPGSPAAQSACAEVWRLCESTGATPLQVRGFGIHIGGLEKTQPRQPSLPSLLEGPKGPEKPMPNSEPVILHLDVDCFFLAVHKRYDPSLHSAGPLVLWQYNDVICISPEAKAAGVKKHMRPSEAQPLVEGIGGRMVHAFSRRWPGPRVWYGPYQTVSREMFAHLHRLLSEEPGDFTLERLSIDEAFLDASRALAPGPDRFERARRLGEKLAAELQTAIGVHVSVGIATNRLLAKLGSVAAKPPRGDGIFVVDGPDARASLLAVTPATRLPGCGNRGEQLQALNLQNAAELQSFGRQELQSSLGVSAEVAERLVANCRGQDATPVRAADPKKSLVVTSWLTDGCLDELAMKRSSSTQSVSVGDGWVFEPQLEKGVTNLTRVRWLLLALILDLEERVVHEFLEHGQLPSKLTVSYQGPGWRKEPGPGSTDGRSCSRTGLFPSAAFRGLDSSDGKADLQIDLGTNQMCAHAPQAAPRPAAYKHPVYGTEFLTLSGASAVLTDGPEVLEGRRGARIAGLTNACCALISSWAAEQASKVPIGKLTLTASSMQSGATSPARKRPPPGQPTLSDCFKRSRPPPRAPEVLAAFEISDSE